MREWDDKIRYPIMAGKHKVVSTKASIPKGMFIRDDIDIVNHSTTNGLSVMGLGHIEVLNQHHHTEWKKINKGFVWVCGPISIVHFHFMNEPSLCRIYALARTIMKYGWISFLIYIYLEQPFHLQVTPAVVLFTFFCSVHFFFVSNKTLTVIILFVPYLLLMYIKNHFSNRRKLSMFNECMQHLSHQILNLTCPIM